ncbi:MAG: type II toxin-antitoxin system VapC family toxin [Armatimonadetes bacterium]|nr:type II toxin-antitoxin system VapC family toxin [Armatimonadota bacterium]
MLAWLAREPGAARVRRELERAEAAGDRLLLSTINAGEVYYRLAKSGNGDRAEEFIGELRRHRIPVQLVPATTRRVWNAARLKARYPIAYADGFAAALAREYGRPLLTGDREFEVLERAGECEIVWL